MSNVTIESVLNALGGAAEAARALGIARTTVLGWRKSGQIPAHRVLDVHDATKIPIAELLTLATQRSGRDARQ